MFNTRLSVEEFMKIVLAPENADRRLQLIDGEIVEDDDWWGDFKLRRGLGFHLKLWFI